MVENDDLESFSQTFSQFSLCDEIFQINSQTVDPTIFDQCTPELEFLCETNESISKQLNTSETENLIGFLKGEAITDTKINSLSPQVSCSDPFLSVNDKPITNFYLKNKVNSSDDSKDNIKNKDNIKVESPLINGIEIEPWTESNLNSQLDLFADVCSTYEKSPNIESNIHENIEIEVLKHKGDIITQEKLVLEAQIHDYIEGKTKKNTRGRPLKAVHIKPNLNKIKDPGKLKYVSRRYKNNIASQHSRIKRNLKGKELKIEHKILEQKKEELKQEKEKWESRKVKLLKEIQIRNIHLP